MNQNFPRMLYKTPGSEAIHGGQFATLIVDDEDEQDAALADGWSMTTPEAKQAAQALADKKAADAIAAAQAAAQAQTQTADTVPPTRAEMEQKATELGIQWRPQWGDKKLADTIAATLET